MGYSRDGFHFYRPSYEPVMGVNETEGAWNWGNMQSIIGVPLIVGDSLYLYSSGRMKNKVMWMDLLLLGWQLYVVMGSFPCIQTQKGYLLPRK